MQAVIDIPSPTPRDSETVVTALETAAIFCAKGDTAEALRWLQRAAESAGDDGDDERTLALARTAADLSRSLREPTNPPPPPPAPPPRTSPPNGELRRPPLRLSADRRSEEPLDAPPSVAQPSHRSSEPAKVQFGPPPAPSSRPLPPDGRSAPSPPSSRAPGAQNAVRSAPPSRDFELRYAAPTPAEAPLPQTLDLTTAEQVADTGEDAELDEDAQRVTQPVPIPSPHSQPPSAPSARTLRHAARVSAMRSPNDPGLFLVRVLEDGAEPPEDAAEALMVLVDPHSTLFAE